MNTLKIKTLLIALALLMLTGCDQSQSSSDAKTTTALNNDEVIFQGAEPLKSVTPKALKETSAFVLRSLAAFEPTLAPVHKSSQQAWQIIAAIPSQIINDAIPQSVKDDVAKLPALVNDAKADDATAMLLQGIMYWLGLGEDRAVLQAQQWLTKASDLGEGTASLILGNLYQQGQGNDINIDVAKAFSYYQAASKQGSSEASINLYHSYLEGKMGVTQDDAQAKVFLNAAIQQGDADGYFYLAQSYQSGTLGHTVDFDQSIELLEKGAALGSPASKAQLVVSYFFTTGYTDEVKAHAYATQYKDDEGFDSAQRDIIYLALIEMAGVQGEHEKAKALIDEAWQKSGETSSVMAGRYGLIYDEGNAVAIDHAKSAKWLNTSWALDTKGGVVIGEDMPRCLMAEKFAYGRGFNQDYEQALIWYQRCVDEGSAGALNSIGILYDDGKGVVQNKKTAKAYYEQAAEKGNLGGLVNLGHIYFGGVVSGTPDDEKAVYYYEKAAKAGANVGMAAYAQMFEKGYHVEQDYYTCYVWASLSVKRGYEVGDKIAQRCKLKLSEAQIISADKEQSELHQTIHYMASYYFVEK